MRKALTVVAALGALLGPLPLGHPAGSLRAETPPQGVIYPGRGVDRLTLGTPAPDARTIEKLRKTEGIVLDVPNGILSRITVSSARYAVVRSGLRPGAPLSDVLRFYGTGEKGTSDGLAVLTYRPQGIEFALDPSTDRVRSISVFRPVRQQAPVQKYNKLYQYREQFKVR